MMTSTTFPAAAAGASAALADQLLRRARRELDAAVDEPDPQMRFLGAHLAAIRCASAVLALAGVGPRRRGRPLSVWEQLAHVGEQWQQRAAEFSASAHMRAAIDIGRPDALGSEPAVTADAIVEAVDGFVEQVAAVIEQCDRGGTLSLMAS